LQSLLKLMTEVLHSREDIVGRIPEIVLEDNSKKLADDIEHICTQSRFIRSSLVNTAL
jgi:hypothetical protein